MMYVEFIARDRAMPVALAHALAAQSAWRDPKDPLLGQITREVGAASDSATLAFCRFESMARLDEWEEHFRSPAHARDRSMHAKHQAIHHDRAGCYDELAPSERLLEGRYVVEAFASEGTNLDRREALPKLAARRPFARLKIALWRIGRLAPDPGGLLVWAVPSMAAVEGLARDAPRTCALRVVLVGLYRDFGRVEP
ncbi:MAG: hypothetical protein WD673_05015 [Alphaproteobacteria bacterium]